MIHPTTAPSRVTCRRARGGTELPSGRSLRVTVPRGSALIGWMTGRGIDHATVDRDGRSGGCVPEVARTTRARMLREVEPMARDLIAIMDNIPADSFASTTSTPEPTPRSHVLGARWGAQHMGTTDQGHMAGEPTAPASP
jgi:hypothetical protein